MSGARWIPTLPQISSETIAVVLGAILGGLIVSQSPQLKAWLKANYAMPGGGHLNMAQSDAAPGNLEALL